MKTLAFCILATVFVASAGCNDPVEQLESGPGVAIIYEADPLADVHVRLHASPTGPVLAQAITTADGVARFSPTPSPEPDSYFVSLASISDGGWILDTKYLDPGKNGIQLKPLAADGDQRIELSRGDVRLLNPRKRR